MLEHLSLVLGPQLLYLLALGFYAALLIIGLRIGLRPKPIDSAAVRPGSHRRDSPNLTRACSTRSPTRRRRNRFVTRRSAHSKSAVARPS